MVTSTPNKAITRRIALMALLATSLTSIAGIGPAEALSGPEKYVTRIADDVMSLARSSTRGGALKSRFTNLLSRHSDIRTIARFSLGKYRKKLPAARRSEYYKLVLDYVAGLFVYYIDDFSGTALAIKSSSVRGKWVTINSEIRYSGARPTPVVWRVRSSGSRHRVADVNIRGIWMSIRMRDQFVQLLNRSGGDMDALFAYLRTA